MDGHVVEQLLGLAKIETSISELYSGVHTAKGNIGQLSTSDLLRKDFKDYQMGSTKIGISSVGVDLNELLRRSDTTENLVGILRDFRDTRCLDLAIVTTASHGEDGFHRQMLVFGSDFPRFHNFLRYLHSDTDLNLQPFSSIEGVYTAEIRNLAASRKVVQPLISHFFKE